MSSLKMGKQLEEVMRQGMNLMHVACLAAKGCEGCPFKEEGYCLGYTNRVTVPSDWRTNESKTE